MALRVRINHSLWIKDKKKNIKVDGIFIEVGSTPLAEFTKNINLKMDIVNASIDKSNRCIDDFKKDIDIKFGPDLVKQLNAIFALKTNPGNLVLGQDGEFHKINRDY